ncbi:hypothetical protein [Persicobacter diffluens]|uniref:Uncharacterized protein n=1 Tax=Persicobacter diffluens TaxID=981 RepID=A0AAN4W1E7_9BACT|nr:hypothetical protein PEDI_36610 [Persicobacter diffluens]
MKYLSTFRVLRAAMWQVHLPFLASLVIFPAICIYFFLNEPQTPQVFKLLLLLMAVGLPFLIRFQLVLMWRAWALRKVNDVNEFLYEQGPNWQIHDNLPGLGFLGKGKRAYIREILQFRKRNNLWHVPLKTPKLKEEYHIRFSIRFFGGFFLLGVACSLMAWWNPQGILQDSLLQFVFIFIGLGIMAWSSPYLIDRSPVITLSKKGFYSRRTGWIDWDRIDQYRVIHRHNREDDQPDQLHSNMMNSLFIYFKEEGEIKSDRFGISRLSISYVRMDEYLQHYSNGKNRSPLYQLPATMLI